MWMISIAVVFFVMIIQSSAFLRSRVNHLNHGYKINRKLSTLTKSSIQDNNAFFRAGSFHKIAILIDGDNAEASLVAEFIAEAGRFGKVTVKRIYADWTSPLMKGWKEQLNSYAVRPIQKFAYTKNKSSTDTALIIDAMDLLHSKLVDGFCIVSSDSDYTGLAHRIREEGLFIMGIGKTHTPEAFVKACESFTYSEILSSSLTESMSSTSSLAERILMSSSAASVIGLEPLTSSSSSSGRGDKKAYKALSSSSSSSALSRANSAAAIANAAAAAFISPTSSFKKLNIDLNKVDRAFRIAMNIDTGHCMLSRLSEELRKLDPTFDHRNFGYPSFRKFCEALQPNYEIFYGNGKDGKDFSTLYIMESCNNNNNNSNNQQQQQQQPLQRQQSQSAFSSQQQQQPSAQDPDNVVALTPVKAVNLPPLTSSSKSAQKANTIKLESASSSVTTGTTRKSTTSTKKELETVIAVASTVTSSITTSPTQQRLTNTVVTKQTNHMDTSVIKLERSKMMEENKQQVNNVDDDDEGDVNDFASDDHASYSSNNQQPMQSSSMMSVVEEAGDADVDLAMSSSTSSSTNAVMDGMRVSERRLQSKMKAIEKEMMALLEFDSSPTSTSDDDDDNDNNIGVNIVKQQQPHGIVQPQIPEGSNRNPYFDTSELYFTNPDANNLDDTDKAIFIPTLSSSTVVTSTDKLMKASSVTAVKERERELEKETMTRLKALRAREVARKKRAEEETEALWYFSRYEDD